MVHYMAANVQGFMKVGEIELRLPAPKPGFAIGRHFPVQPNLRVTVAGSWIGRQRRYSGGRPGEGERPARGLANSNCFTAKAQRTQRFAKESPDVRIRWPVAEGRSSVVLH